ncbi:MAG: VWA domain-containing protein [Acidobacteria bacterium]|nr:VWA domain-containing protein [Acidobacteriota bacterium]
MVRTRAVATLAVLGIGVVAAAAGAGQDQPPFRSGVDVAEIDVSVVDARGRPVTNLGPSEFAVHIDGEPRRVVEARLLSPSPAGRGASPSRPAGLDALSTSNASAAGAGGGGGRRVVIVVDRRSLTTGEGRHAFRAAADFIDRLHPLDRVALYAVWSSPARINFTSDHRRVRDQVVGMAGEGDPWDMLGTVLLNPNRVPPIGVSEAFRWVEHRDERLMDELVAATGLSRGRLDRRMFRMVQEVRYRAVVARREVEELLAALRAIEGPKAVVWISGGFVMDIEGTRTRRIEELAAEARTTLFTMMAGEVTQFNIDRRPRRRGRRPTQTQDLQMLELGLSQAARRTGGEFFRLIGDPRRMFERIEAQLAGHYLLGVEVDPRDPVEDRWAIEVAVARRGAETRLRHGNAHGRVLREARAVDPDTLSVDERLLAMLRSPAAEPLLPLRVSTYAFPHDGQARVAVTAEVGSERVDGADVAIGYALLDTWGTVVSTGRRRMAGTAAQRRGNGSYAYTLPITTAPGRYALRVAAIDGAGRDGSVEHPLRAGVALSDAPVGLGTPEVADAERRVGGGEPDGEVVVSSGRLAVTVDVHAESYWVFNRLRVAVEVARDEEGPALVQAAAPLRGRDEAPQRRASARLAVGELTPGRYVARVRALRGADEVTRVVRPFRIAE